MCWERTLHSSLWSGTLLKKHLHPMLQDEVKAAIKSDAYSKAIRLRREEVSKKAAEKAMEEQNERDYQASRRRG